MKGLARVVAVDVAQHVTQRGNRANATSRHATGNREHVDPECKGNSMFWIGFIKETFVPDEPGERGAFGLLRLGSWEERFVAHLDEWSKHSYSQQWRRGLGRVVEAKSSALVTDMWLPTRSSHLTWWPMWRFNNEIVFHNQLFFFEQHGIRGPEIEIEDLYHLVGPRQTHDPEGTPVSEWTVPVSAILKFLDTNSE